jgi:ATP-dependent DNA ligase
MDTISPMLAKAVTAVPDAEGLLFEPKWDGFRAIVHVSADGVEIHGRSKPLTRYFPELVAAFAGMQPCILDGEIVVRSGPAGNERLDWELLSQRIHPADSRVQKLAVDTPAQFVAFDLLSQGLDLPFAERRAALEALTLTPPIFRTQTTTDADEARRWLAEFEGAGLDGVVAKPLDAPYTPGRRTMLKIKHHRSADVVLLGYRVHTSGAGVGSLLLGLYDDRGELQPVGGVSAFSDARRKALVDELAPLVTGTGERERSRFTSGKDRSFVTVEPSRVLEVRYDQMEGARFRHTVQFERWRPDRSPRSCTFEQLEIPVAYDLSSVLF